MFGGYPAATSRARIWSGVRPDCWIRWRKMAASCGLVRSSSSACSGVRPPGSCTGACVGTWPAERTGRVAPREHAASSAVVSSFIRGTSSKARWDCQDRNVWPKRRKVKVLIGSATPEVEARGQRVGLTLVLQQGVQVLERERHPPADAFHRARQPHGVEPGRRVLAKHPRQGAARAYAHADPRLLEV